MTIRDYTPDDAEALVDILKANGQYSFPDVEGPEAMAQVAACDACFLYVAELGGAPVAMIKGTYDGSRAVFHLLSVHPDRQRRGIGTALVEAGLAEFRRRGARSYSVTASGTSRPFWARFAFQEVPVYLMLRVDG